MLLVAVGPYKGGRLDRCISDLVNDPPFFAQVRLLVSKIDRYLPVVSYRGIDDAGAGCRAQSRH